MDTRKKLTQARLALLFDQPFFGNLALNLNPVEKKNMPMPTMATDGTSLFYDPDFVDKISREQLMAIIVHEIMHCALNHISRRHNREKVRWNLATDFAVNEIILKSVCNAKGKTVLELPDGCLVPGQHPKTITGAGGVSVDTKEFINQNAESIYSKIPEPETITIPMSTVDSHDEWEGWGNGKGKNGKNGDDKGDEKSGATGGNDQKPEKTSEQDEGGDIDNLEQQWRERVAQAATTARMAGFLPGHLAELVDGVLQPKLDWKSILRDMVTSCAKSDFRIMPPNKKHLWRNFYLPGLTGEEIRIAVAIDTSGSISSEEIHDFLAEVQGICDAYDDYTIYLFACDAAIHGRWEIQPFDELPRVLEGRGGTSFKEPFAEAEKLPVTSLVYLTDLYPNEFPPEPLIPVIWVATTDVVPPYGQVIRLPREN